MKKFSLYVLLPLFVIFLLLQLIPVERTNPPVSLDVSAPPQVASILKTSCYDCHSNETKWPWYSYVAPISWLVSHDVKEGRSELNFSTWDRYSKKKKTRKLKEIWEEVAKGKMPMSIYLLTHAKARMDNQKAQLLKAWTEQESKRVNAPAPRPSPNLRPAPSPTPAPTPSPAPRRP